MPKEEIEENEEKKNYKVVYQNDDVVIAFRVQDEEE
tara:strand:+ start:201 stop:308 length:108 start_codon:yes stop_codon:yes gene_type:complete